MPTFAAVIRSSHLGGRKIGASNVHVDREQLDPIKAWAKNADVELEVMEPEWDVSGGLPLEQRPSLLRAIEGVERGEYAGIVVAYLSRFGRSTLEQLKAWKRVEDAGGRIVVVRENIDTSTASGRLQRDLLLGIATHEREQHIEHFDERRRLATEAGIWQRRQTPRGYRRDAKTRHLVPDRRASEVRAAFRDRATGATISELAKRLGMTGSGVRQLLKNRIYLGELRVGRYVNPSAHPALVTVEEWEAAQLSVSRPARSTQRTPALLAGLVRCASCGHLMTRGRSGRHAVYACPERHSGGHCPAPASIMTARLDGHVAAIAVDELKRLSVTAREGRGEEQAKARLADAERELSSFLEGVKAADLDVNTYADALKQRKQAIDDTRSEWRAELARRPALPEGLDSGADAWAVLKDHERNLLLRALLSAVVVRPAGRGNVLAVELRTRVIAFGADFPLPVRPGGEAMGVAELPFPDLDDPRVLRSQSGEDSLQGTGGVTKVRRHRRRRVARAA